MGELLRRELLSLLVLHQQCLLLQKGHEGFLPHFGSVGWSWIILIGVAGIIVIDIFNSNYWAIIWAVERVLGAFGCRLVDQMLVLCSDHIVKCIGPLEGLVPEWQEELVILELICVPSSYTRRLFMPFNEMLGCDDVFFLDEGQLDVGCPNSLSLLIKRLLRAMLTWLPSHQSLPWAPPRIPPLSLGIIYLEFS